MDPSLCQHEWKSAPETFLFPVRTLLKVFRGKFIPALRKAFGDGELSIPARADRHSIENLIQSLRQTEWVVYCKSPFSDAAGVLDYLGRYTHRMAISNDRLLSLEAGKVRFSYRDRRRGNSLRGTPVPAEELIRRFLLHVLPASFIAHPTFRLPLQPVQSPVASHLWPAAESFIKSAGRGRVHRRRTAFPTQRERSPPLPALPGGHHGGSPHAGTRH